MMFGILNDTDVDWLIRNGELRRYATAEAIIREREPIDAVFIVLNGRAVVTIRGIDVASLGAGEILGEVSLVDSRLPTASVVPTNETTVLRVQREVLQRKLKVDDGFASRFYHAVAIVLAQRLQRNDPSEKRTPGAISDDSDDDLESGLLESFNLAGLRFDQLLKRTLKVG
jgi:signal-transduction protein with cAMP-binding, CBS, and nucleotidyltransferase domain